VAVLEYRLFTYSKSPTEHKISVKLCRNIINSQVDVMFHESHASIARPTLLVVVADDVFVVRVRMFGQVALDQVACFLRSESGHRQTRRAVSKLHSVTNCDYKSVQ